MEIEKTIRRPLCSVCNSTGVELYKDLSDKLFGSNGKWNLFICTKKSCNTIWLNPAPAEEEIYKAYQKYYTHIDSTARKINTLRKFFIRIQESYLANKYGYPSTTPKFLGLFLFLAPLRRSATDFNVMYLPSTNGKLLDVGCGSGEFLFSMQFRGWEVTGIDSDLKAVQVAQSKGLDVKNGNLFSQNFKDESFDAIVLSHFIEHVYDPKKILIECKRLLKKGGKLVVATPNNKSLGHFVFKRNWRGLEPPRHINLFSISSLKSLAILSGFVETNIFTIPRISRDIFIKSYQIKSRKEILNENNSSMILKFFATVFTSVESLFSIFYKYIGEEIILIIKKNN